MKTLIKVFAVLIVLLTTNSAFGLFGIGINGGVELIDMKKLELSKTLSFTDLNGDSYSYGVERDAITNPIHVGAQFQFDLPVLPIGIEADFGASWADYKWTAPKTIGDYNLDFGTGGDGENFSETYTFLHANADITVKYYILNFPPVVNTVSFYVGGGAGYHYITPLVSPELVKEELKDTNISASENNIDVESIVEKGSYFGGHFVVGARIKPPVIPFSFNIDYKHYFLPKNDYGDDTSSFGQIKAGMNFYL